MWYAISATRPGSSTGGRWRAPGSRGASRWWRTAGLRTTLLAAVPACSMAHARRAIRRCTPVSIRSSGGSSNRDAPGRSGSRHRCRSAAPPAGGAAGAHSGVGWRAVALPGANGWLGAARVVTDAGGRVNVDVTLGPRAGPVEVRAQAGTIERQATLYAEPGPAATLTLRCGDTRVERRVSLAPGGGAVLRVAAQDA